MLNKIDKSTLKRKKDTLKQISKASIQFVSGSPSLLCILHSMAHTEENLAVTSSLRCDCYSDNTFIL